VTGGASRLAVLILHGLGDPRSWRAAVRDVEYLLPDHLPAHDYIVHPVEQPLPAFVQQTRFHAIVLGPTFLCARYVPWTFEKVLADYAFVGQSDAVKIALPQDDYDCNELLDNWMMQWRVDTVFAACSSGWPVLYPRFFETGRIRQGYTGYIPDAWLRRFETPKPRAERPIDVSYRANRLPPNYGRIGRTKTEIGDRFAAHPATAGLRLDISTDPAALIFGSHWHDFVENSRFCLASNSGSSLLDPVGAIRRCVERRLMRDPAATFEEVEAQCFPGQDGRHHFTAISPRNLEAAIARTVQIATPGPYSGLLEAGEHYVPLEADCSNAGDVVSQLADVVRMEAVADRAREAVLAVPELRAANHARALITQIEDAVGRKHIQAASPDEMAGVRARYDREVGSHSPAFWASRRRRARLREVAVALGARKLKRWLMPN
jgi:hypothetical protein